MKAKNLLIMMLVLTVVLFYNLFCYHFVNKMIDSDSKYIISTYFRNACITCEFTYDYKKAVLNDDGSINIYVKYKNQTVEEYYRFVVVRSMGSYQILEVNNNIPPYIK